MLEQENRLLSWLFTVDIILANNLMGTHNSWILICQLGIYVAGRQYMACATNLPMSLRRPLVWEENAPLFPP